MDKDTRNLIFNTTQAIRRLLEEEFSLQLEGTFDIHRDGKIAEKPGPQLTPAERLVRQRIVEAIQHRRAGGEAAVESVRGFQAEAVFTFLNRLAALKMMEARGLVLPCVSQGDQSQGFKEFSGLAPGLIELPDKGYRLYLECLFDEIGREVGVLFDRTDAASQLWPRRKALETALEKLNNPELASVWVEDETIGWIYQYYNDPEERKQMREDSSAPRNSRELAVRNQFFTPRYVVEFLTDNTLGRIWYEMTRGETKLKGQCRYLVRRPNEIFLKPGETAPEQAKQDNLSQEHLLKQAVHIPHRPIKDPRSILMLDPACGSMHFGLYAFELFEVIYAEAWDLEGQLGAQAMSRHPGLSSLHKTYPNKEAFLRDVPRLIIEHNIHGIDIDPRAAQIAGLALWLRAQKAWQQLGIKPVERPTIRRSNIVCAEPMPGEKDLLREFVEKHFSFAERPLFQRLLETVWEKMQLAGEAGSLLKIEEEIRTLVANAKLVWKEGPKFEQTSMFPEMEASPTQKEMRLDLSGITDEQFWDRVEDRIYAALGGYAEQAESSGGFQRRLFAEDAARGFAFIDVCRKRYDVALMNPPFGSPAESFADGKEQYPNSGRDIYAMFVERMGAIVGKCGLVGAILPRTGLFIGTMVNLRKECYLRSAPLGLLVDLGKDVLDGATIRTACYVIGGSHIGAVPCIRIGNIEDREQKLLRILEALCSAICHEDLFLRKRDYFLALPASAIAYWIPEAIALRLPTLATMDAMADIRQGIATGDNFRFLRLLCELPAERSGFCFYSKGGEPVPFISDESLYVRAIDACAEMKANAAQEYGSASRTIKNEETFGVSGITYSQVNDACLKFRIHPTGAIYDMKGPVLFPRDGVDKKALLGFLNSAAVEDFMRMMTDGRQWHVSALKSVPAPAFSKEKSTRLCQLCVAASGLRLVDCANDETGHYFSFARFAKHLEVDQVALDRVLNEIEDEVWDTFGASRDEIASFQRQRQLFLERTISAPETQRQDVSAIVKLALGFVFGRWNIRYATGEQAAPELPDPFAPLPVCPPGQLQNAQGLPARPEDVPAAYPVRISWDGILVDDPNHPLDVVERVREVLRVIWKDRAEIVEHEASETLGVKALRDYFRKPGGFFADHLKRYSKSRRQAPIYWSLSSPNGLYAVWLYYHRLTPDTLFTVQRDHLKPKLEFEEGRAFQLRQEAGATPSPSQRRDVAEAEELVEDLRAFKAELERVAPLFRPDLNDGVIINHAPLWRLIGLPKWRKDCQAIWNELVKGDYDWAHLALHLWPERVIPKCASDRSLAIAHGLEEAFWQEDPDKPGKWIAKKVSEAEVQKLIASGTSPAVKAALESLTGASASDGAPRRARKKSGA